MNEFTYRAKGAEIEVKVELKFGEKAEEDYQIKIGDGPFGQGMTIQQALDVEKKLREAIDAATNCRALIVGIVEKKAERKYP